jgi:CDP-paratose 2-epimerase
VISLLDLLDRIEALDGRRPAISFEDWRTGDQRYYVSDTRRFQEATGWKPRISAAQGTQRLYRWLRELRGLERGSGAANEGASIAAAAQEGRRAPAKSAP